MRAGASLERGHSAPGKTLQRTYGSGSKVRPLPLRNCAYSFQEMAQARIDRAADVPPGGNTLLLFLAEPAFARGSLVKAAWARANRSSCRSSFVIPAKVTSSAIDAFN